MNAIILHDLTLGYDGHPAVHHLSGSLIGGIAETQEML